MISLLAAGLAVAGCAPLAVGTGAGTVAYSVAQERTAGQALTDSAIKVRLKSKYLGASPSLFADVGVDVNEGRVLLTGSVPTRADKVEATRLAWDTSGVRAVEDALTVGADQSTGSYVDDVLISNQIRYDLVADGEVKSVNYNVETVNGVVHLTGLARSPDEIARVIDHARTTRGVRRVVSHVLAIDDPRRFRTAERTAEAPAL
ncbi:MAG TPA: BON domain-containing protein [Thermohalobaculum sp.]|nr:BON domain-containing protein [Thermohalobaculum sp.]